METPITDLSVQADATIIHLKEADHSGEVTLQPLSIETADVMRHLESCTDQQVLTEIRNVLDRQLFLTGQGKYNQGKIYCIKSNDNGEVVYVGSTIKTLEERWSGHKSFFRQNQQSNWTRLVKERGGSEKFHIELLETFPCQNNSELLEKEKTYIHIYNPPGNTMMTKKPDKCKHITKFKANYAEGIVYKITYRTTGEVVFVGVSVKSISQAWWDHEFMSLRYGNKYWGELVRARGGLQSFEIEHIADFPCNSEEELLERLKYYVDTLSLPNKVADASELDDVSYEWNLSNPWFIDCVKACKKWYKVSDEAIHYFLENRAQCPLEFLVKLDDFFDRVELYYRRSRNKENFFTNLSLHQSFALCC